MPSYTGFLFFFGLGSHTVNQPHTRRSLNACTKTRPAISTAGLRIVSWCGGTKLCAALGWNRSVEVYFIASGCLIAHAWEARGGKEGPAPILCSLSLRGKTGFEAMKSKLAPSVRGASAEGLSPGVLFSGQWPSSPASRLPFPSWPRRAARSCCHALGAAEQ